MAGSGVLRIGEYQQRVRLRLLLTTLEEKIGIMVEAVFTAREEAKYVYTHSKDAFLHVQWPFVMGHIS